jgi:hypothetical protein
MLLVEMTINAALNYISIEGHGLTHNWRPRITDFDAPTINLPSEHGGFAKMTFGTISFNPMLFQTDWPPPVSCPISIYHADSTEEARELVFSGNCHLETFDRESVTYALYGPSYDEQIIVRGVGPLVIGQMYEITNFVAGDNFTNVGGTNVTGNIFTATGTTPTTWTNFSTLAPSWNATLNSVIANVLLTIPEITQVNTSLARGSSPNVTWTLVSNALAIDFASAIAQFYSHLIYVDGTTAYLIDMFLDNQVWNLMEHKFFSFPKYQYKTPVAKVESTYDSVTYASSVAYPYGETITVEPYHTTQANIEAALEDILSIENAPRVNFDVPMIGGNFPALGKRINILDTAHIADLSAWIRARKMRFDFLNDSINIEGEGGIEAG